MKMQESFWEIAALIRRKPGMYLGVGGSDAIPRVVEYIVHTLVGSAPANYRGPLIVSMNRVGTLTVEFSNVCFGSFHPASVGQWVDAMSDHKLWMLSAACGFCERFEIHAAEGEQLATLISTGTQGFTSKHSSNRGEAFVRFVLEPFKEHSGGLHSAHLYSIAGILKDVSVLHPGLATKLAGDLLDADLSFFYADGMRSLLFEEDHSRFSLGDCVDFSDERGGLKVDGCLRFLHAGNPHVRNYVNFSPTQGGAHLEGIGKALSEVFPDEKRGCRPLTFITNPNTGARVDVPHSFIGALHLQMDHPHFDGPTKDILTGDDVREFVYSAVLPPLSKWRLRRYDGKIA